MISLNWLPETAYFYILIFARVGSILMLMPALGEMTIPARMRLGFALVFSLVLYPLIVPTLPPLPSDVMQVLVYLIHELAVGLILGAIIRLVTLAASVAGAVIAFQTGLSGAQGADPVNGGSQGALIGAFLSMLGVALIFATDLHHVALMAICDSYMIFSPRDPLMFGDAAEMAIQSAASALRHRHPDVGAVHRARAGVLSGHGAAGQDDAAAAGVLRCDAGDDLGRADPLSACC